MVDSGSWKASARLVFSNSPRPAKAFEHLRRTLAPARVERASVGAIDGITATWLEAFDGSIIVGVDHPSLRQSEVIVNLFSIVAGLSYVTNTPLAVPDHALGRMLMRSPKIDLSAAIHEACAHFLKAPFQTVADMALAGQTVVLPAGDGYLLTEAIFPDVLGKTRVPVARARTFILKSQAGLDQLPIAPASSSELGVLAGTWQLLGAVPERRPCSARTSSKGSRRTPLEAAGELLGALDRDSPLCALQKPRQGGPPPLRALSNQTLGRRRGAE